ncbi:MAG: PaaI family thioesterase [Candidatus Lambdaproteobacteria bacterium]|nr:PaaI family thioesterase [Candidatus Lambdaproteobacteria bacterium]
MLKREPGWNPFVESIGLHIQSAEGGTCRGELEIVPTLHNPFQSVHGGAVFSMADCCMAEAVFSLLGEGQICSTIENKVNFIHGAGGGRLRCEAQVQHRGRSTAVATATVSDGARVIARLQGTFAILDRATHATPPGRP